MAAICAGGIGFASTAFAADGRTLYMDSAKGNCSTCHGSDGKRPIMPSYPKLVQLNKSKLSVRFLH